MRVFLLLCIIFFLFATGMIQMYEWSKKDEESGLVQREVEEKYSLPTERFVMKHLMTEKGLIRTDLQGNPEGKTILSESMGLWLEYLSLKGDQQRFDDAVLAIKENLINEDNLVVWKIEGNRKAMTNALIDDLRIIAQLFRQGELTKRDDYIQLAIDMSQAIAIYNRQGNKLVDFYDSIYRYKNQELTLSYLIPEALNYMVKYGVINAKEFQQIRQFMMKMPTKEGFFPKSYSLLNESYFFEEELNLIDQLYVAIHLRQLNINTAQFFDWIKQTYEEEKCLYGRYDLRSKKKTVEYESVAVYALAIIYSVEKEEYTFATELYEKMKSMMTDDEIYEGGYVYLDTTHSFDNLLALVAERKLINERVVLEK